MSKQHFPAARSLWSWWRGQRKEPVQRRKFRPLLEQLEVRDVPSGSPPTASGIGGLSVVHGHSIGINLLAQCSDPENDGLSIQVVDWPAHGMISYNSTTGNWDYQSMTTYAGSDSFTFKAFDGTAYSNVANVTLTATNIAPVANNIGPLSVAHGMNNTISGIDLAANSSDADGDNLFISIASYPSHGMLMF